MRGVVYIEIDFAALLIIEVKNAGIASYDDPIAIGF